MAIVFTEQKKTQKKLIVVFIFITLIILVVLWQGFIKEDILTLPGEVFLLPKEKIEINFGIFDHPKIKKSLPFREIEPFEEIVPTEEDPGETLGRKNPFVPY